MSIRTVNVRVADIDWEVTGEHEPADGKYPEYFAAMNIRPSGIQISMHDVLSIAVFDQIEAAALAAIKESPCQ